MVYPFLVRNLKELEINENSFSRKESFLKECSLEVKKEV
jgi:hypothetical protein